LAWRKAVRRRAWIAEWRDAGASYSRRRIREEIRELRAEITALSHVAGFGRHATKGKSS
jgi:hypothetical protein